MESVAIGEADASYASALERTIEGEPGLSVAGRADTVASLLVLVVERDPGVVLVDVGLPGGTAGLVSRARELGVTSRFVGMATMVTPRVRRAASTAGLEVLVAKGDGARVLDAITATG